MSKAFLSVKFHADARNRPLIEAISQALRARGIETICIARDLEQWGAVHFASGELMQRTFERLRACDYLLVEISEKGVGVGIEAGYAHALGKPVWVIAKTGADIPETLRGIAAGVETYEDLEALSGLVLG